MEFYPLYSALADLYDMHGLSLNDDEFETYAFKALEFIGNFYGETISEQFEIIDYKVQLPEDCQYIEQVTTLNEDYKLTDSIYRENYSPQIIESYIESRKQNNTAMIYQPGAFINYEYFSDKILKFKVTGIGVRVMYRRRMLDSKGLPMITKNEVDAISSFCIYIYNSKKLNATKDKNIMELLPMYKREWQRKCDNARTPEYMNQNDIDNLANVLNSWDRKQYGLSSKMIK